MSKQGRSSSKLHKGDIKEISYKKTEKEVKHSSVGFWTILVLLLLATAFFIPWKTISRTEAIPYIGVEEYTIQEPYITTNAYNVPVYKMPHYGIEVDYQTTENNKAIVGCNIINEEAVSVRYNYYIYTTDKDTTNTPEGTTYFSQSTTPEYVTIAGYGSLRKNATLPAKEFFGCHVLPDLVDKAYPVLKYQNTTNYRDVTKTRNVTKYRNEIVYTTVNWILGTRMPWQNEFRE